MRVLPAHEVEECITSRTAPSIRIQQPGWHLYDQRHGEIFPVGLLDQPTDTLQVNIHQFQFMSQKKGVVVFAFGGGGVESHVCVAVRCSVL